MLSALWAAGQTAAQLWTAAPALPVPVANNAVAAVTVDGRAVVYSFLGIDSTKRPSGVTSRSFKWSVGGTAWRPVPPPPGPGRLAATAQPVRGAIYLFGGYTVAADGSERSLPNVDILEPSSDTWRRGAPIPVPVDDAVSGVWRDSLVYLISGWHDRDNVANVQIYDPAADRWTQGTPIPGTPVFGHTGGIAGNTIVYMDGTRRSAGRPRYGIVREAWRGDIDPADPATIRWRRLPDHPGPPVYRGAGAGLSGWILVAGGTDNPYNYDGVGYDGRPAEPSHAVLGFQVARGTWHVLASLPVATMDHRSLAVAGDLLVLVGGMEPGRRVTARVVTVRGHRLTDRR